MTDSDNSNISNEKWRMINDLEKDTKMLTKKAKKRLPNTFNGRSDSMIEKFVGWTRRKKTTKIQAMLNSLFPKLKHSEEEIKVWAKSVNEKKEAASVFGKVLLNDIEHQITLYQSHMEFLDEIINDIRQLDYDVVREISELKVALHFNQELMKKSRESAAMHKVELQHIVPQSPATAKDWNVVMNSPSIQRVGGSLLQQDEICLKIPNGISGMDSNLVAADTVVERLDSSLSSLVWDGAESKRKSLASRSISLNDLPLAETKNKVISGKSESQNKTPTYLFEPESSRDKSSSKKRPNIISNLVKSVSNGIIKKGNSLADGAQKARSEATPIRQRADSSSSGVSSSSETPSNQIGSNDTSMANSTSVPSTRNSSCSVDSDVVPISAVPFTNAKKRYKNGRDNAGLSLSSFLQILQENPSSTEENSRDSDENELIRRINKCLSLKQILLAILQTVQNTQNSELVSLRKMKALSKELSSLLLKNDEESDDIAASTYLMLQQSHILAPQPRILSLGVPETTGSGASTISSRNPAPSSPAPRLHTSKDACSIDSESDVSFNYSEDSSKLWHSEASNGSEGAVSPMVMKFSKICSDERRISSSPAIDGKSQESFDTRSVISASSQIDSSSLHETANEFIDDLKALVAEEQLAKDSLKQLQAMIQTASEVDAKLHGTSTVK